LIRHKKIPEVIMELFPLATILLAIALLIYTIMPAPIKFLYSLKPAKDVSKLGPQELVKTYYKSLEKGDISTAKACLSNEYRAEVERADYSDLKNLTGLEIIRISKPANIPLYKKNYREVQIVAEYSASYWRMGPEVSGKEIRFIYVGKKTQDSPWKIIGIGCGP